MIHMKRSLSIIFAAIITATASYAAVTVNVIANGATGLYQSSGGTSLAGSTYSFGWLDETAYDLLGASQTDFGSVDAIWTELGSGTISGSGEIFSIGNSATIPTSPAEPQPGTSLYLWVFNDATPGSATEWGIFNSSSWVMPSDLGTVSMTSSLIDNVVAGTTSGSDFRLVSTVPEPSAFAALAGFLALGCVALRRRG